MNSGTWKFDCHFFGVLVIKFMQTVVLHSLCAVAAAAAEVPLFALRVCAFARAE